MLVAQHPHACETEASAPGLAVAFARLDAYAGYNGRITIVSDLDVLILYCLIRPASAGQFAEVLGLRLNAAVRVSE